ncbi:hypothetical protein Tco_1152192 [Tanacetum coccineum]
MATNTNDVRLIVLMALQEAHDEEFCLEEQMLNLMHRFADRFTRRRPYINRLKSLPDYRLRSLRPRENDMGGHENCCILKNGQRPVAEKHGRKARIYQELQGNVKALLLNTTLLTMFVVVCCSFNVIKLSK